MHAHRKIDFKAVGEAFDSNKKAKFAAPDEAKRMTGCDMGAVPPFAIGDSFPVVVDPDLLVHDTLFFNAGRLDRSLELNTKDWLRIVKPVRVLEIDILLSMSFNQPQSHESQKVHKIAASL